MQRKVDWERPIHIAKVNLADGKLIHIINLHLKSKIPSNIPGQKINNNSWRTAGGWAEGYFISSMKRVGLALEARVLIDQIFDLNPNALIAVCGDINANSDQVPVKTIAGHVDDTGNADLAK